MAIRGPFTPEEKVHWDEVREVKVYLETLLADPEAQQRGGSQEEGLTERIAAVRSSIARADAILVNERVILSGAC